MVVFEIQGTTWPLDDRTAETLAVELRLSAAGEDSPNRGGSAFLADAIESALVGGSADPIPVDEDAAEALLWHLNAMLRNPDAVEPAYGLYLEVRRFLGRLYS